MGPRGPAVFGPELLNTGRGVGRCAGKPPVMEWPNAEFKKKKVKKKIH